MITVEEIKKLRKRTGLSIVQCKDALEESSGDITKAIKILQKRGSKIADKKCERSVFEGYIGSYVHTNGKIGVLVEVNCETDFVARSDEFRELAHDLAMHIAAYNPEYVNYNEIDSKIKNIKRKEFIEDAKNENKPQKILDKIVEGRMKKHFDEICLLTQPFAKDPDKTVEELIEEKVSKLTENIKVKRFIRFEIE